MDLGSLVISVILQLSQRIESFPVWFLSPYIFASLIFKTITFARQNNLSLKVKVYYVFIFLHKVLDKEKCLYIKKLQFFSLSGDNKYRLQTIESSFVREREKESLLRSAFAIWCCVCECVCVCVHVCLFVWMCECVCWCKCAIWCTTKSCFSQITRKKPKQDCMIAFVNTCLQKST